MPAQQEAQASYISGTPEQLALLLPGATTVHPGACARQNCYCVEGTGYLACDDAHDHGLGGPHKHMVQAHGAEQAVCAGQAGVGMHKEGRALHEGPQVYVHVPLIIRQTPVHAMSCQSAPYANT